MDALLAHAATVGTTSVFGTPERIGSELLWRTNQIRSCLEEVTCDNVTFYVRSQSFDALDPTEASAISYFLGMAVCSALAHEVFGTMATVHVDNLLQLLGKKHANVSRPDLIGYTYGPLSKHGRGQYLFEAKGTKNKLQRTVLTKAKAQVENPPGFVDECVFDDCDSIASLAYFAPLKALRK